MKNSNTLTMFQVSIVLIMVGFTFYGVLATCATTQPAVKAILVASI